MSTKIAPSPGHRTAPPSGDVRSIRACDYCRSLKVRCIAGNASSGKCQRCAKSGRDCIMTAPQKRKQRKRTDTRVTELEKEVRAMRVAFSQDEGASHQTNQEVNRQADRISKATAASTSSLETVQPWGSSGLSQSFSTFRSQVPADNLASTPFSLRNADVIDRGLLSMTSATQLFDTYVNDLVPHYPVVVFAEDYTAAELRHSRPTLFLAVIAAAASGNSNLELSAVLNTEVLQAYATRTFMNSEKSLELVQAMLVTAVWYNPPNGFAQLKFYEYIHMAAIMALDIGLGTKPDVLRGERHCSTTSAPPERGQSKSSSPSVEPDAVGIENMRTYLACYLICAGVSMTMRRSNMLRFNNWTSECMECLKCSPYVAASDKSLLAWVKLVKIADDMGAFLPYDDPGKIPTPSDSRGKLMLKNFEKELISWKRETSSDIMRGSIAIMLHHNSIYLHEIALHADHAPGDFKSPYQVEHLRLSEAQPATAACIDPITKCINSAHSLVDTFLGMEINSLPAVPVFIYVRVSYALFILAKLHVSANNSTSKLREYIDRKSLKVGLYLDATIACLGKVVEQKGCKVPSLFLRLLIKFQTWYRYQEAQPETAKEKESTNLQTEGLYLPNDQRQTEATGSFDTSEYMLAGSYPFGAASQDLEKRRCASATQQVLVDLPIWNPTSQTPFQNVNGNPGHASNLQELVDPNAVVFANSANANVGQLGLTDEFQYTSTAAFDDQMDLDLEFFSLFGGMSNTSGEFGEWALPTSHVGNMSDEQMPKNEHSQLDA